MFRSAKMSAMADPFALGLTVKTASSRLLLTERDCDHNCTHHVILLEVIFRTVWVCVVAVDAGLRNSPVGINGLEIRVPPCMTTSV
jgi:hypothetical protein